MRDEYTDLGVDVAEIAAEIFAACGAADDFCIQHGTVFGGTNRLILDRNGWHIDRGYCTPRFISAFDSMQQQQKEKL